MARTSTVYICQQCSYQSPQYLGKCPNCGSWNTLVESIDRSQTISVNKSLGPSPKPVKLSETVQKPFVRLKTEVEELDRVLGGGVVPGSVVLLAGDPGIGKSTLLLQIAKRFKSLYVSGEESVEQIKLRFDRLGEKAKDIFDLERKRQNAVFDEKDVYILAETNVDQIIKAAKENSFEIIVVDSIQTMITDDLNSAAGTVGQVRETAYRLHRFAKEANVAVFIIGQVTKEGTVAGPKVLEHLVDTVLYLEGEAHHTFRILSATKNRFGPIEEIGVFEMSDTGMEQVRNPSKQFLSGRFLAPGSIVVPILEGSRSVLTEIQALTNPTSYGLPVRRSLGFDPNRLQILVATMIKRASVPLQNQDIFINVAGGLKIAEPAADLAVCLAIVSSVYDKVISKDTVAAAEVGLLGELREIRFLDKRLEEAKRLGFKNFITFSTAKTLKEAISVAIKQKSN